MGWHVPCRASGGALHKDLEPSVKKRLRRSRWGSCGGPGRRGGQAPKPRARREPGEAAAGARADAPRPGSSQHPLGKLPACCVGTFTGKHRPRQKHKQCLSAHEKKLVKPCACHRGDMQCPASNCSRTQAADSGVESGVKRDRASALQDAPGPALAGSAGAGPPTAPGSLTGKTWSREAAGLAVCARDRGLHARNPAPGETRGCRQPSIPGCCRRVA